MEERTQCLGCGGLPFRTAVDPGCLSRGLGDTAVPGPEEVRGICLRCRCLKLQTHRGTGSTLWETHAHLTGWASCRRDKV